MGFYPLFSDKFSDNVIILDQPSKDDVLVGRPCNPYHDLITKVFKELNADFDITYLNRCLGKTTKEYIKICRDSWLSPELFLKSPKVIFLLGQKVATNILGIKGSMKDILSLKVNKDYTFVVNYHPSFVLNRGKRELETFKSIFRVNIEKRS